MLLWSRERDGHVASTSSLGPQQLYSMFCCDVDTDCNALSNETDTNAAAKYDTCILFGFSVNNST